MVKIINLCTQRASFIANWTNLVFSHDIDAVVGAARGAVEGGENVFLGGHSAGTGFTARALFGKKPLSWKTMRSYIGQLQTITATLKRVEELRMEHLHTETTLASLQRDSPDSPRIETLNSRLHSLDEQITVESAKISGPEQDQLNQILARYKELEIKLEFANKLRLGSESLFEKHRVDAMSNSRFISVIQHPFLPEDSKSPANTESE